MRLNGETRSLGGLIKRLILFCPLATTPFRSLYPVAVICEGSTGFFKLNT